ncbi:MAG: hypothetical protein HY566_02225 [Candidatus Kerfeldbacteria bacterium]|nr:hypothetical protein [Candidatus Kerfeldbacteria bacterium]
MFLRKKPVDEPPAAARLKSPVAAPKPIALQVEGNDERFEAYAVLATKHGVRNGAFLRAALLRFCQREEIPVYSNDAVWNYLNSVLPFKPTREGSLLQASGWVWYPLRERDVGRLTNHIDGRNGSIVQGQYHGAVPLQVLHLVDKVAEQLNDVRFFVGAAFESAWIKDPFLMVTGIGMGMIIIAHWDEPGFKLND